MAAVDDFLKIDGIEGESSDSKHKGQIELESWSWSESNSGSSGHGGGAGAGKVSMQDFQFTMKASKASPKLFLACAEGTHIKSCVLTCRKAGGIQREYIVWKFTDVLISSYQMSRGGGSGFAPIEQCSFNFSKVEFEYKEQKADGTLGGAIKSGYDVKANKKI
jgi:type VI secretion system secreted protein Hcp